MSWIRTREAFEKEEFERLAPYAMKSAESRGRLVPEPAHPYRTAFQRDRDRIVHSQAFRRLEYKTQVFVYHEGDHYRNRLTHTLEGGQVARTIARTLRLHEELGEAIVLAHDLGHTPFGHAGERALDALLEGEGGFDHNRQTLRIVDLLEERYAGFRGLNLTHETREGILKHGCHWEHPVAVPTPTPSPPLEAQLADLADEVAYTIHDLDDGLRSGLLTLEMLESVTLWREMHETERQRIGPVGERVLRAQTLRSLTNQLVTDIVESTAARLEAADVGSVDEVRASAQRLLSFSSPVREALDQLKTFLFDQLYSHPHVVRMSRKAEQVLGDLYRLFRGEPSQLPRHVAARFGEDGEARAIADYIAGMTDRFALSEHRRLLDLHEPV